MKEEGKIHELKELNVYEVSLVDSPANKQPFLLLKMANNNNIEKDDLRDELAENVRDSEAETELKDAIWFISETLKQIKNIENDEEKEIKIEKFFDDFEEIVYKYLGITIEEEEEKRATEEELEAQKQRAKKWKIESKEVGNVTKPKEYNNLDDDQFADPTNYKYPIDKEHIRPARVFSARRNAREKGMYTEAEWKIITDRIEDAAKKFKIGEFKKAEDEQEKNDFIKIESIIGKKIDEVMQGYISRLDSIISFFEKKEEKEKPEEEITRKNIISKEAIMKTIKKVLEDKFNKEVKK